MSETQTSQTVQPVRREVVVDCDAQRAFDLFTADMTSWWPKQHHIGSTPIAEIVIEPHPGGRWYTRHEDGSETNTGFVVIYDSTPDEGLERVPVACPHCWSLNQVLVGAEAAANTDYRAEKA